MAQNDIWGSGDQGDEGQATTQVQDQWGRSPGDPMYGQPPGGSTDMKGGNSPSVLPGPMNNSGGGEGMSSTQPVPAPGTTPPPDTGVKSGGGASLGGGWDQYASDPKSFQAGLMTALQRGLKGDAALEWADANGWKGIVNPNGGGVQAYSNGQFGLPGGYKVVPGANGTMDIYQVAEGGRSSAPSAHMTGGIPQPGGATGVDSGGPGGGGAPGGAATNGSRSDELFNMLMQRAKQGLDVNPNDPTVRAQLDPFIAQQQRQARQGLAAVAERQGPSGNIGAEERLANEKVGQNTSEFEGQLLHNELMAKRDEIQAALTQMGAQLTDEERTAMEGQIAAMNNALGYSRLGEDARQFDANLGQRKNEFGATMGQRAYEYDTSRYDNLFG